MAKRTPSEPTHVQPRGPMGHGAPYNGQQRDNPTVHSKSTRRYGHDGSRGDFPNSSTGQQPAPGIQPTGHPSLPIGHETRHAKAHSETVGHAPDGSGRFIHPTHPNTGAEVGGDHRAGASTAGTKGMAEKA